MDDEDYPESITCSSITLLAFKLVFKNSAERLILVRIV